MKKVVYPKMEIIEYITIRIVNVYQSTYWILRHTVILSTTNSLQLCWHISTMPANTPVKQTRGVEDEILQVFSEMASLPQTSNLDELLWL